MTHMLCGSWENTYPFWSVLFCLLQFLLRGFVGTSQHGRCFTKGY